MSIEIKSIGGAVLFVAETAPDVRAALTEAVKQRADLRGAYLRRADLQGAYLQCADLQGAYLQCADLQGAYLRGADLRGAYLRGADLRGAYLQRADLQGAYLRGARGINPALSNDLLMMRDQVGKIRAYKLVTADGHGPTYPSIHYVKGGTYEVPDAVTDETQTCAAGINLATLSWCMREWQPGYRILIVEFTAKDIAALPIGDGKFRVFRCKVVGEKNLVELGLVKPVEVAA